MKANKLNLGKYNLNKVLRNPGLIHRIQDGLMELKGEDMVSLAFKRGAKNNIKQCIKSVVSAYHDNSEMILGIVGEKIMNWIWEHEGIETKDDLPPKLFQSPQVINDTEGQVGPGC